MNRISAALATATLLALAGCGGSGTPTESANSTAVAPSESGQTTTAAPQAKYGLVSELHDAAVAAGYTCLAWTQDKTVPLAGLGAGAAESENCNGDDTFATFASPGQLEQAINYLKENNALTVAGKGTTQPSLVGENWIIQGPNVVSLQPKLGGTILQ